MDELDSIEREPGTALEALLLDMRMRFVGGMRFCTVLEGETSLL